jgi:hypothetical protein
VQAFTTGLGRFAEAARLIDLGVAGNRAHADSLRVRKRQDDHFVIDAAVVASAVVYEAGPTGFGLVRACATAGVTFSGKWHSFFSAIWHGRAGRAGLQQEPRRRTRPDR